MALYQTPLRFVRRHQHDTADQHTEAGNNTSYGKAQALQGYTINQNEGTDVQIQNEPDHRKMSNPSITSNTETSTSLSLTLRVVLLLFTSFSLVGNYYAYDIPAAINLQLQNCLNIDESLWQHRFGAIYAAYSLPNIVMPLLIAKYGEMIGIHRLLLLLTLIVLIGQLLSTLAIQVEHFPLLILGRFLHGLAGESIGFAQARLATLWFTETNLGLALTANLAIAKLGSVAADVMSPRIVNMFESVKEGCISSMIIGCLFCILSFLTAIIGVWIENFSKRVEDESFEVNDSDEINDEIAPILKVQFRQPKRRATINYSTYTPYTSLDANLVDNSIYESKYCPKRSLLLILNNSNNNNNPFLLSNYLKFNLLTPHYWFLTLMILSGYSSIIPFTNIASYFLQVKWYPNQSQLTGILMSIPDLMSLFLVPIVSLIVNGVRTRLLISALSGIGIISVHTLFAIVEMSNPIHLLFLLGLFYALLVSVVWTCIPFFVLDNLLELAYSTSTCLLNLALTVSPFLVAKLINLDPKLTWVELYFSTLGLITTIISLMLLVYIYYSEVSIIPSKMEELIAEDYESIEEAFDIDDYPELTSKRNSNRFNISSMSILSNPSWNHSSQQESYSSKMELSRSLEVDSYCNQPRNDFLMSTFNSDPNHTPNYEKFRWLNRSDTSLSQSKLKSSASQEITTSSAEAINTPHLMIRNPKFYSLNPKPNNELATSRNPLSYTVNLPPIPLIKSNGAATEENTYMEPSEDGLSSLLD